MAGLQLMEGMKGNIKVILKPNSSCNRIAGFDNEKKAYIIEVKAPAHENKANIELVKFLSKSIKKKVRILKGLKSREKILEISEK
ncbi:MAG: DUF167 domain-containing protein [Candidatus Nanoarchaeia archaeon]|nr:DUF167 domain-containing protein [Candidatus Nanoarchaeia archaeon]